MKNSLKAFFYAWFFAMIFAAILRICLFHSYDLSDYIYCAFASLIIAFPMGILIKPFLK
jgi:hypothetical protein